MVGIDSWAHTHICVFRHKHEVSSNAHGNSILQEIVYVAKN